MQTFKSCVGESCIIYKRSQKHLVPKAKITQSSDCAEVFRQIWEEGTIEAYESFYLIGLNAANNLQGYARISVGGVSATVVDQRVVMRYLLEWNCTCFILAHNHPSGNTKPSHNDRQLTNDLKKAGEIMGFKLLDHIILTEKTYYSFADEGEL